MKRPRVCVISYKFAPVVGGAEKRAEKHARQLQAFGYEASILTLRLHRSWKRKEVLDGLPVLRIGGIYRPNGWLRLGKFARLPSDILIAWKLWQLRHSYDLLHVCQVGSHACVATLMGQLLHKPVVISSQSSGPSEEQRQRLRVNSSLLADTLTDADFLHVDFMDYAFSGNDLTSLPQVAVGGQCMVRYLLNSRAVFQVLSSRSQAQLLALGFPADRVVQISGSVDAAKFVPRPELRPAPLSLERPILCVSRMDYCKGIDVLLHAWSRMLQSLAASSSSLRPRLLLVGDGHLRPQMEQIAEALGIQNSVDFLGLRQDVLRLLQQAWGFVLPSRWEGMPNALLEAMSCALPCVATRVSGSEDIIDSEVNGLLVPSEQPAELAAALLRIVVDAELATRLARAARETVVEHYQLPSIVERCLELYQRLLKQEDGSVSFTAEGGVVYE